MHARTHARMHTHIHTDTHTHTHTHTRTRIYTLTHVHTIHNMHKQSRTLNPRLRDVHDVLPSLYILNSIIIHKLVEVLQSRHRVKLRIPARTSTVCHSHLDLSVAEIGSAEQAQSDSKNTCMYIKYLSAS